MTDFRRIKHIFLDIDGTLTDGGIYYDSQGNEIKRFNVKDGLGIKVGIEAGIEFNILTGRESPMVTRRAAELGIQHVYSGIQEKYSFLDDWMKKNNIATDEICYIGDDLNDLKCMKNVGVRMCPHDAAQEVIEICDFVSEKNSGHGAVRECMEFLLKKRCQWEQLIDCLYCR